MHGDRGFCDTDEQITMTLLLFHSSRAIERKVLFGPCLVYSKKKNSRFRVRSNLATYVWYGTLNIDENKNQLHSLSVNRETNFLSLITS